uniref:SFRICE_037792 n=1 Tax=Spodoptera frugiperda TaxID=7108 RepID=A0A2H1WMQ9_SPOFR
MSSGRTRRHSQDTVCGTEGTLTCGHRLTLTPANKLDNVWSVNVWAGIYNGQILGPVFLPQRLDGARYLKLINHDGAPLHVVRSVRERLSVMLEDRWIGRLGPQAWPPRSPDLTPLDFFVGLREHSNEDPTMMPRLHAETYRRARLCIEMNAAQFELHLVRSQRI